MGDGYGDAPPASQLAAMAAEAGYESDESIASVDGFSFSLNPRPFEMLRSARAQSTSPSPPPEPALDGSSAARQGDLDETAGAGGSPQAAPSDDGYPPPDDASPLWPEVGHAMDLSRDRDEAEGHEDWTDQGSESEGESGDGGGARGPEEERPETPPPDLDAIAGETLELRRATQVRVH